mmetsp:Transcript_3712/g.4275  ORF Transcript_3712/g.4275 Transcript_3712/m.4275 type:complete len:239 (-) Transcript_3712:168-884(-)
MMKIGGVLPLVMLFIMVISDVQSWSQPARDLKIRTWVSSRSFPQCRRQTGLFSAAKKIMGVDEWTDASQKDTVEVVEAEPTMELTFDNVDTVLDEVRPYLQSDGGNIRVVSVDPALREINVALQGACGSCPSSTVTMQMGVERVLREKFGELAAIRAVSDVPEEPTILTVDAVEDSISQIRPAVEGMKGTVKVDSVDQVTGTVRIAFTGPELLKRGIELTVKDNKLVSDVVFICPCCS